MFKELKRLFKDPFGMPFSYRLGKFLFPTFSLRWKIRWGIANFLFPKQKWLTKKIPNSWCDKTHLIPELLFAMVVHFVEKEMEIVNWEATDHHSEFAKNIRAAYKYIKEERPALEKKVDEAYPKTMDDFFDSKEECGELNGEKLYRLRDFTNHEKECYERVREIEAQITELDTKHLTFIVSEREMFWT